MPGTAGLIDPFALPGMGSPSESTENEFLWGNRETAHFESGVIVSTAADAGSTPTTTLRAGLLMGQVTATKKWKQYNPAATDGSEVAQGILRNSVNMLDSAGSAADKSGLFVIKGFARTGSIYNLDALARRQMFGRFLFDDDFAGVSPHFRKVTVKATDYTVLATDNDTIFTTRGASGAVIFTLPTLARGLHFQFFNEADQDLTVASVVADTMVVFNDLAADSVKLGTSSEKIGGWIEVFANDDASKWLVKVSLGAETQTPTIAT